MKVHWDRGGGRARCGLSPGVLVTGVRGRVTCALCARMLAADEARAARRAAQERINHLLDSTLPRV